MPFNAQSVAFAFLGAAAVGGVAWVFVYPLLSGEKKAEQRRASLSRTEPVARQAEKTQRSRREQVEGSLKEVEERRQKQKKVSLSSRITQAGLTWSKQKFLVVSGLLGAAGFAIPMILTLMPGVTSAGYVREIAPVGGPVITRSFGLAAGESTVIELQRDIKDARPADSSITSVNLRTAQSVYITGLNVGQTGITLIGADGIPTAVYTVAVTHDVMAGVMTAIGLSFAAGFGLPRFVLNFLKKRREKKFLRALPDAVDVIVRGIKAGLPLFESIKVVAADAPEPLKTEFMSIIETQSIGMPLGEACGRLFERMPLPEVNFFGIVVAIQTKSGGNLSEALGNLSKVLRDRKKMAEKIQAMSMEAKASAGIIGALPPIVMLLVYLSTPDYISLLWTHPTGRLMLAGCAVWMSAGIFVMKKMINFDF
jgi:Flp pilus assembly protein TadB